jgi:ATP-binding cassette subfamily C (CFTR/MRP) protein 1
MTIWNCIPLVVAFTTFAVAATVLAEPLTSDVIFPALALFNLLATPLAMVGSLMGSVVGTYYPG